jgi:hypothetical protein
MSAACAVAALAVLGAPRIAAAQQACSAYPNPVYISGSSASEPVLEALAGLLTGISIIYFSPDSCLGLSDMLSEMPSTEQNSGVGPFYLSTANGTGSAVACNFDATPQVPDIGVSDVFLKTCESQISLTVPAGVTLAEIQGPIQAMTFVVPSGSDATAISGEAAYVVFGYDGTPAVGQWNAPGDIFVRANTSGTLNMIGTAIGLNSVDWANTAPSLTPPAQQASGTGAMFTDVSTSPNANATIGILSYEGAVQRNAKAAAANPAQPTVKILPYQPLGASCGYLPDSSSTSPDRINVRQGAYDIWGPLHFLVKVDSNGNPVPNNVATSPAAMATVLNYFIETGPASSVGIPADSEAAVKTVPFPISGSDAGGITPSDATALVTAESTLSVGGVVPWCAMQVLRTSEIGAPASYQPAQGCGCFFENSATGKTVSPYCQACSSPADCNDPCFPKCNYGFCEAQ